MVGNEESIHRERALVTGDRCSSATPSACDASLTSGDESEHRHSVDDPKRVDYEHAYECPLGMTQPDHVAPFAGDHHSSALGQAGAGQAQRAADRGVRVLAPDVTPTSFAEQGREIGSGGECRRHPGCGSISAAELGQHLDGRARIGLVRAEPPRREEGEEAGLAYRRDTILHRTIVMFGPARVTRPGWSVEHPPGT